MKKEIKKCMNNYIYKTSVNVVSSEAIRKHCYVFGYLDGYFDEVIYHNYTLDIEQHFKPYSIGLHKGINDRLRMIEGDDSLKEYKEEKVLWLKKLAMHDALNGFTGRKFSARADQIYNIFVNSDFSLKKNDFDLGRSEGSVIRNYVNSNKTR